MNAYRQITALLLRRGCTSEARDVNDMTPLMVCAMEGASSLIAVLVTGSANKPSIIKFVFHTKSFFDLCNHYQLISHPIALIHSY